MSVQNLTSSVIANQLAEAKVEEEQTKNQITVAKTNLAEIAASKQSEAPSIFINPEQRAKDEQANAYTEQQQARAEAWIYQILSMLERMAESSRRVMMNLESTAPIGSMAAETLSFAPEKDINKISDRINRKAERAEEKEARKAEKAEEKADKKAEKAEEKADKKAEKAEKKEDKKAKKAETEVIA
jgi:hypothetical protein